MTTDGEQPIDQPTMREAAIALHEWYTSLRDAGFTEREGVRIIAEAIRPDGEAGGDA